MQTTLSFLLKSDNFNSYFLLTPMLYTVVGSKVHEVRLQAEQGNVLTVQDLVKKIYEVTEIPPANQKILYKGLLNHT